MEDPNPQSTRKRPRLDSGNSSHERMSLSPRNKSPGRDDDQVVTDTAAEVTSSRESPDFSPSAQRPSSRVTINMKSPVARDGNSLRNVIHERPTSRGSAPDTSATEPGETPEQRSTSIGTAPGDPSAVSVAPSPSQSVEIEIAEVEDMDQDPSTSQWRPLGEETLRAQEQVSGMVEIQEQLPLVDTFPQIRSDYEPRESVDDIRKLFEKGSVHSHDETYFIRVTEWLEQCVNRLSQLTYQSVVVEDREFWEELPMVVEGILRRDIDFQPDSARGSWACLESFFTSYAQLALKIIDIDTQTLRIAIEIQSGTPDLVSKTYWPTLGWLLKFEGIPFYRTLEKYHSTAAISLVSKINDNVSQCPVDALRTLSRFMDVILASVSTWPMLGQYLTSALTVVHNMVISSWDRRRYSADASLADTTAATYTLRLAYDVLRPVDNAFQSLLSKKPSWITNDTAESFRGAVGPCYQIMAISSQQFGRDIAQDLGIELPQSATAEENAHIVTFGWRFIVLKRQITDGRMELRVQGVEIMQQDLVNTYNQYIRANPSGANSPIPRYFDKFIRDHRLLEYLVGVDSHPQLISRAGNIAGFLVVTDTYNNGDSDILWKAVTESHDPRFVSEILGILGRTMGLIHGTEPVLYLCKKLVELPLNRFDQRMIEYFDHLINLYREKHYERTKFHEYSHVDVVPVRLCVRLIREVRSETELSADLKSQLQQVAGRLLSQLIANGISDEDKIGLFQCCTQDISEMNEFAVGSIHALLALTSPYDGKDVTQLALEFDLTRLVIAELASIVNTASPEAVKTSLKSDLTPRLHLLLRVADKVPDTISLDSCELLWESLFMAEKLNDGVRAVAWEMLSKSLARCAKRNAFLERLLNDFLPRVPPERFTPEVLTFSEQAVSYNLRFDQSHVYEEDEVITIPGMERIWHIILTAPPGTVEMKAINFAIDVYLDDNSIRQAPRSAAEATHVALVDRCVEQLKTAASKLKGSCDATTSGEDEPMVIVPSASDVRLEELRFSRSLLFLRQLLHGLRTRPQYTPPAGSPPQLELKDHEVKGELIEVSYQAFGDSGGTTRIRKLKIGDLSTLSELSDKLVKLIGFSKFSAFSGGRRVPFDNDAAKTLRDLKIGRSGLLIVKKHPDAIEMVVSGRRQSLTLVDSEVLKHFDDLYDLLGLDDRLSKEIFDFLVVFPPQERARLFVRASDTTIAGLFPLDKPYKLLYSIRCLTTCLREEVLEAEPNAEFIAHSIRSLVDFLTKPEMDVPPEANSLKLEYASNAVDCLMVALTAKQVPDESDECFRDPSNLTSRLMNILHLGQQVSAGILTEQEVQKMVSNSFSVLIEASLHDSRIWDAVKQDTQIEQVVAQLLLKESRQAIRKEVAEIVFKLCGQSPSQKQSKAIDSRSGKLSNPTAIDIVATLWKSFLTLFPQTLDYATSSQEFFEVALVIFRTVVDLSPGDFKFGDHLKEWGSILLKHKTAEFVGREPVDYIVWGFALLMKMCIELAPSNDVANDTNALVEQLFTTYLFPNLSELDMDELIQPNIPVMHSGTREELYKVIILLAGNEVNCRLLLDLMEDVIPNDYTYDPNWVPDRYKTIRSAEGYAGLKNLSNTCYLNSLFTQLFMNVDFRKFMLDLDISDPNHTLLAETKKIFGYMQNTWQKHVDTSGAVECIRTYDNEPIDINIQMDVDEFYNLLFDRWEAQITSDKFKKVFRSFYGGELVQQIKSKECEHISERSEPFSAIQCDIKGKSGLEDSLRAYVEGEIMQGDNKYSCTSCGKHVDAVKRACLKEVPDNLIFHLKRFDFDMLTMIRSKINDEFHFPEQIDMTPYKVEYLSDPSKPHEPDIFELVGVLVHSGTAESGHYYSYIKERPSAGATGTWVEFNDSDVTRFDPAKIPDQCFGGQNEGIHGVQMGGMRFNKVWNAYMLFYQRASRMEKTKELYKPSSNGIPVSVPLPLDLGNHISMENELFIRSFCLLDPYHAYVVRHLLHQSKRLTVSGEPGTADLHKAGISVTLDTLDQIVSRSKELPELENLVLDLNKMIGENADAALWVLEWAVKRPTAIRNLLVRSFSPPVRIGFYNLLLAALRRLRAWATDESLSLDEAAQLRQKFKSMLDSIISTLKLIWPSMHLYARAWDNYFDLLIGIAKLGTYEIELLLDQDFFLRCLEMVWLDADDMKKLRRHYLAYHRLVEKGRKFSHAKMMELLYIFLIHIDLHLPRVASEQSRISQDGKFCMSALEADLVLSLGKAREFQLLKKIIEQQANPDVSKLTLIHFIMEGESMPALADSVCQALEEGLRAEPAALSAPFLKATEIYCQNSPDADRILKLIDFTAKGVESIGDTGGDEHIRFFQRIVATRNNIIPRDQLWFCTLVVERIPDWAPTLLHYHDRSVRNATVEFLQQLLFSKVQEELTDELRDSYRDIARLLAQACIDRLQRVYVTPPGGPVSVDSRVVEIIINVINHIVEDYFDASGQTPEDLAFIQRAATVLDAVEQLTVDIPEEIVSGSEFPSEIWEDNSVMGSDSEVGLACSP